MIGSELRRYMQQVGLDPKDPKQVAQAKMQVIFETKTGGAPTVQDGWDRAIALIRERDPELLRLWRFKRGVGRNVIVEERSAVDRLADVAETE